MMMSFILVLLWCGLFLFSIGSCVWVASKFPNPADLLAQNEDSDTFSFSVSSDSFEETSESSEAVESSLETPRVLMLNLTGTISEQEGTSQWYVDPNSASAVLQKIKKARKDRSIQGLLLCINSGGGGITASDILWKSVQDFKAAQPNRYVVVLMGSIAASGAYYIASAADQIYANPTTLTGSIGVIMNSVNLQELAQKIGVKSVTIKSGPNKDILNPFAELTPEQQTMLQSMVDSLQNRFVKIVCEGRNLQEPHVRAIADGRIFLADEALKLGLIDEIGYLDDAKNAFRVYYGTEPKFITQSADHNVFKLFSSPAFWGSCAAETIQQISGQAQQEPILLQ